MFKWFVTSAQTDAAVLLNKSLSGFVSLLSNVKSWNAIVAANVLLKLSEFGLGPEKKKSFYLLHYIDFIAKYALRL